MENKELVKDAVKSAEEELRNEEKQKIKNVVKATLELLQQKEEKRKVLDNEIKILKLEISDLKDGRLDRLKERQDLDPKAKEVSVIVIKEKIIEKHIPTPNWYMPWIVEVKPQYIPNYYWGSTNNMLCGPCCGSSNALGTLTMNTNATFTTTNSDVKMYTSGTYVLENNIIKNI